MDNATLKELLDELHDKYNSADFIAHDPISVPHMFSCKNDIEIAGFLASTIAWGNRKAIVRNAGRMTGFMGGEPYRFVAEASDGELATLEKYVHRTFNGNDFIDFIKSLRHIYARHGGLGEYFQRQYTETGDIRSALSSFRKDFFRVGHAVRCEKHLSSIDKGAACKRLNMFLRWMVRSDNRGVDFGLWPAIPASALYLPLDLHSGNMGRALGLLSRRQNDWKAVEEITYSLRLFDPRDPVKYDFALFGAGIDGYLK